MKKLINSEAGILIINDNIEWNIYVNINDNKKKTAMVMELWKFYV